MALHGLRVLGRVSEQLQLPRAALAPAATAAAGPDHSAPVATAEDYSVGEGFLSWNAAKTVRNGALSPRWLSGSELAYVRKNAADADELVVLDLAGTVAPAITTAADIAPMLAAAAGVPWQLGLYIRLSLCSTLYQISYHIQSLFFLKWQSDITLGAGRARGRQARRGEAPRPD
jgi:hypothetical protein